MSQVPSDKSIYKQIALDIAQGIIGGRYPVGVKLRGRSTLASQYNVSPETIRRAVALLEKGEVLEVMPGAGIIIRSEEHAQEFVNRLKDLTDLNGIRNRIHDLMQAQRAVNEELMEATQTLLDAVDRFNYLNPLILYEIEITESCDKKDRTIGDLRFWKNTYATILAIKRQENTIPSPGPYAQLRVGDTLLIVGDEASYQRAKTFLYSPVESMEPAMEPMEPAIEPMEGQKK